MSRGDSRTDMMALFLEMALFGTWNSPVPPPIPHFFGAVTLYKATWKSKNYISEADAMGILQTHWTSATLSETETALYKLAKRSGVKWISGQWKILRPEPAPPPQVRHNSTPLPKGVGPYGDPSRKLKPGVCPRCGFNVRNPNRHKNLLHTGDDCRLNIVKGVLEE